MDCPKSLTDEEPKDISAERDKSQTFVIFSSDKNCWENSEIPQKVFDRLQKAKEQWENAVEGTVFSDSEHG